MENSLAKSINQRRKGDVNFYESGKDAKVGRSAGVVCREASSKEEEGGGGGGGGKTCIVPGVHASLD